MLEKIIKIMAKIKIQYLKKHKLSIEILIFPKLILLFFVYIDFPKIDIIIFYLYELFIQIKN